MKKLALILLVCTTIAHRGYAQCGVDRWAIKTLADGATLDTSIHPSTIAEQNTIARPTGAWRSMPRQQSERELIELTGTIVKVGKEDDNDVHIVLVADRDSMIVEIPDPDDCPEITNGVKQYRTARAELEVLEGKITNGIKPASHPVLVTVRGYGFFDKIAHGSGHAENGRELHPVLSIKRATGFVQGSSRFTGTIDLLAGPNHDKITVSVHFENQEQLQEIRIVDMKGVVLIAVPPAGGPSDNVSMTIPMSNLGSGTYFVYAVSESGLMAKKFQVNK
jgi:hypothetical protein